MTAAGSAWIAHNAAVWARAGLGVHDHRHGETGCEVCGPKTGRPHGRDAGDGDQPGWNRRRCGNPACFCAEWQTEPTTHRL